MEIKELKRWLPYLNLVLAIIIGLFFVLPKYQAWRLTEKELSVRQELFKQNEKMYETFRSVTEKNQGAIAFLEKVVPREPQEPELLVELESIAITSGAVINSINLRKEEAQGRVSINISVEGSYGALKEFLKNLEQNLRLMDVLSLSLSPLKSLGSGEAYSLDLSVVSYFTSLTEPEGPGPEQSALAEPFLDLKTLERQLNDQ